MIPQMTKLVVCSMQFDITVFPIEVLFNCNYPNYFACHAVFFGEREPTAIERENFIAKPTDLQPI